MRHLNGRVGMCLLLLAFLVAVRTSVFGQANRLQGDTNTSTSDLFGSSWPAYRGDQRNTGFSPLGEAGGKPWTRATTSSDLWGGPGFAADGTLYVVADSLYAIDGKSGKQKWHFYAHLTDGAGLAVGQDGLVYFTAGDAVGAVLYAVEAATGKQKWAFEVPSHLTRLILPTVGSDGTVYICSGGLGPISDVNALYAVNGATGKLRWSLPLSERSQAAPLVGRNGRIFCLTRDSTFSAVDAATRKTVWTFHVASATAWAAAAMNDQGIIFLAPAHESRAKPGRWECELVAIDSKQGNVLWRHPYPQALQTPSIGRDGTIYAGGSNGSLYAFDGKTGEQKWAYPTAGTYVTSPALAPDGMLYFSGSDGYVYALKAQSGEKVWQTRAGRKHLSSPIMNASGLLYVNSLDQNIYAIRASDGQIATEAIDL